MSTATDTLPGHASPGVCTRSYLLLVTLATLVMGGASSCASYPSRTEAALGAFQGGDFDRALTMYEDPETTGSEFLAGAEAGTVALAAGDWDATLLHLGKAAELSRQIEDDALLSPDKLSEALLTLTVSESMADYVGEGYERVLLHAQLAMAYLAKGQFESARVEVRRANQLLETEEQLYEKDYQAGGLGHFLSAIIYELEGSPDDAYIDYKRMQAKGIGGRLVGRSLVRLANTLHRTDELPIWEEQWGEDSVRPDNYAEVVVVASIGLGPYKRAITIPVPTGDGIFQWSVPTYEARPENVSALELTVEGSGNAVSTSVIEDVTRVSKENLDDRIAWLATRSAVRGLLKQQLTKQLEEQYDGIGWLVGNLIATTTERADLRSWLTLPGSFQGGRAFLEPGTHELTLRIAGGAGVSLGTFEMVPGETIYVFARSLGPELYANTIGGQLVEPEPVEAAEDPAVDAAAETAAEPVDDAAAEPADDPTAPELTEPETLPEAAPAGEE